MSKGSPYLVCVIREGSELSKSGSALRVCGGHLGKQQGQQIRGTAGTRMKGGKRICVQARKEMLTMKRSVLVLFLPSPQLSGRTHASWTGCVTCLFLLRRALDRMTSIGKNVARHTIREGYKSVFPLLFPYLSFPNFHSLTNHCLCLHLYHFFS